MPDKVLVGDDMPKEPEDIKEDVKPEPEPEPKAEPKLYAGKYKSPEDLEKSYSELEKKLGEQGSRLGETEKEKSILLSQLEQMQSKSKEAPPTQDTATDFDAMIQAIADQVEEGELSVGDGFKQTGKIVAQMAEANTINSIQQQQQQQTVESSKQTFTEQNPDFFEMQKTGALEEIKNQLPGFHDDVSAYFAYKAQQTQATFQAEMEATRAKAFEEGKAEMAKLADGDKNTQKVLQRPASNTGKEIGRKSGPLKQSELRASGLEALNRARGG